MKRYLVQWCSEGHSFGYDFEDFGDATDFAQFKGEKSKITDTTTGERIMAFYTFNDQRWGWTADGWIKIKN
jgi:hypothetical protein